MYRLVAAFLLLGACSASIPLPEEAPRVQKRLLRASFDRVWEAAAGALGEQALEAAEADPETGRLVSERLRRVARSREFAKELVRIAEVERARRLGMAVVTEFQVEYTILVSPFGERASVVEIATEIGAVDRSQGMILGGFIHVIPRYFSLPSKGVLEREMLRRIAERLFLAEEMLYALGDLGRD